ncbi:MAG TPA: hypothetical protein V6D10_17170 [Trichocoleus sp.]
MAAAKPFQKTIVTIIEVSFYELRWITIEHQARISHLQIFRSVV